jgi:hypothetical protein
VASAPYVELVTKYKEHWSGSSFFVRGYVPIQSYLGVDTGLRWAGDYFQADAGFNGRGTANSWNFGFIVGLAVELGLFSI